MVSEDIVQMVSVLIAASAVVVGVASYISSNRTEEKHRKTDMETRQAQLFMEIYNKFDEQEFTRNQLFIQSLNYNDYDDWLQRYGSEKNIEAYSAWVSVGRFFHGVGVLVEKGLVSEDLVFDLMGDPVIDTWETIAPIMLALRERHKTPEHGLAFETMYRRMKSIKEQKT